ncbi:hypothetical protein [Mycolicibacterium porcinum]|uniref:DUF222 domain-containing protein n=1 Tax=Mycolicibacterium porcinum TaxID=39693 RepID=A0ABV3VHP5_9MYCO
MQAGAPELTAHNAPAAAGLVSGLKGCRILHPELERQLFAVWGLVLRLGQGTVVAVTNVRRSPWLNGRAQLLVTLLRDRHGLELTEDTARQDISERLDHVATLMRIGRQAARRYVTDEVIADHADRIAQAVRDHHPTTGVVDLAEERRRRR